MQESGGVHSRCAHRKARGRLSCRKLSRVVANSALEMEILSQSGICDAPLSAAICHYVPISANGCVKCSDAQRHIACTALSFHCSPDVAA
jgi:hypothetical protein